MRLDADLNNYVGPGQVIECECVQRCTEFDEGAKDFLSIFFAGIDPYIEVGSESRITVVADRVRADDEIPCPCGV